MQRADHFAFQVTDMDRAIRFYVEDLGLRLLFREVSEEHEEEFAFLEVEGGNLELLKSRKGAAFVPQPPEPPYCPHLAFGTEDMSVTLEMIREKEIPIVKGPLELAGKVKWIYVNDPDHNVIEFIEWIEH
jgi:lactoylglutathione lyase